MTEAQLRALEVLTKGGPMRVSSETDYDGETVNWRSALVLRCKGYARRAGRRAVEITDDGLTAARREGLA